LSEQDGLPRGWTKAKIGIVFSTVGGGTPSTKNPQFWEGNVPWITSADINDKHDLHPRRAVSEQAIAESATNRVPAGSVIVATRVGLGKVGLAKEDVCFSQDCQALLFNDDNIDPTYVVLQMSGAVSAFKYSGRGTTIDGVTKKQLLDVDLKLAPLPEQRRIVAAVEEQFSRLDAGMAALERVRTNLKRYRTATLKAAVEGRLTEAWREENPSVEPASELLERILKARRDRWERDQLAAFEKKGKKPPKNWRSKYKKPAGPNTDDLPELPERWCWTSVERLLIQSMINGISVKGSDDPPGVQALRLSAMSDQGFDYADHRYIPIDDKTAEALAVKAGDFFVSRGNGSLHLVGRGTLAQAPADRIVFPDTMIRLRFSDSPDLRSFLSVAWASRVLRTQIEKAARTTAGIYKISQRDIGSFAVPLPPVAEQAQIIAETQRRLSIIQEVDAEVEANLKRAVRLRQSILKRAFEGKLVPQDPTDEPASELLARIKAERERSGPTKRRKTRPARDEPTEAQAGLF
jgi:type I restriction enzyme S subunit